MKVLVIGDANSIYVKSYIEHVLCNENNEIVLATIIANNKIFEKFYKEKSIFIEELSKSKFYSKIPYLRATLFVNLWAKSLLKKYGEFDYIHIHGVNISRGNLMLGCAKENTKIIVSVWGSELLRGNSQTHNRLKKYYDKANYITVENIRMKNEFCRVYNDENKEKLSIVEFGDDLITEIDKIKESYTRNSILQDFGINPESITVCVGYNRNPSHRHLDVVKQLSKLSRKQQEKITLLFPMTYGPRDEEYLQELDNELAQFGGTSIKFEEYLANEENAKMICACDVFVHAQISDAQSMTLMEQLYSGSIVFNGSWLQYPVLNEKEIEFYEFDEISQLSQCFSNVLENLDEYKQKTKETKEKLADFMSWEKVTDKWLKLFD